MLWLMSKATRVVRWNDHINPRLARHVTARATTFSFMRRHMVRSEGRERLLGSAMSEGGKVLQQHGANLEHGKSDPLQADSVGSTFRRNLSHPLSGQGDTGGDDGGRDQRNPLFNILSFIAMAVVGGGIGLCMQRRALDERSVAVHTFGTLEMKVNEAREQAYKAAINSQWHIERQNMVERHAVSAALLRALSVRREYVIVAGPLGSGKTTAVARALEGRSGVMHIKLYASNIPRGAWQRELVEKYFKAPHGVEVEGPALEEFLLEVKKRAPGVSGGEYPLVLVVEVVSTRSPKDVAAVAKTLKEISADDNSAKCVLVLSDTESLFGLPADLDRRQVVWIDGFTAAEAEEYFDKCGVWQGEGHTRKKVIEQVGLRPVNVVSAVANANAVDEFIERKRQRVSHHPGACIATRPEFAKLFKALLSSQEGRVRFFDAPSSLLLAMKEEGPYQVVLYNPVSNHYEFYSPALRYAVEQWYSRG